MGDSASTISLRWYAGAANRGPPMPGRPLKQCRCSSRSDLPRMQVRSSPTRSNASTVAATAAHVKTARSIPPSPRAMGSPSRPQLIVERKKTAKNRSACCLAVQGGTSCRAQSLYRAGSTPAGSFSICSACASPTSQHHYAAAQAAAGLGAGPEFGPMPRRLLFICAHDGYLAAKPRPLHRGARLFREAVRVVVDGGRRLAVMALSNAPMRCVNREERGAHARRANSPTSFGEAGLTGKLPCYSPPWWAYERAGPNRRASARPAMPCRYAPRQDYYVRSWRTCSAPGSYRNCHVFLCASERAPLRLNAAPGE